MTPSLDAVIPTRNRDQRLPRVIEPLLDDPALARVIVVDDAPGASGEASTADLKAISERVEVVQTGGVGPAKARQAGAEAASAEAILFLDDDVVPTPGLASRHAARQDGTSNLLVCGYTPIAPRNGRPVSAEAAAYGETYEKRCRQYELDPDVVLTHLWGGNFSIPRETALAVGLDSPEFAETWHEDRDFGLRCREAGVSAVFDRGILAHHEYERAWEVVAEESYRRGYSLVVLRSVHGAAVEPVDAGYFTEDRPLPLRLFVRAASGGPLQRPTRSFMNGLRRAGERFGMRRLQLISVQLLRLTRSAAGANDALAERDGRQRG